MSTATLQLNANQADSLEAHVDAVSLGLQALALLLVRERQALTERVTPDVLDLIARDKQAAVANVTGLYSLLRDSLESLATTGADFAAHVLSIKQDHPQLASRVDQLVELTRECQVANQENGGLVNARLRGTRGMLESLQEAGLGHSTPEIYGPPGIALGSIAGDRLTVRA